jgi:hypothetical protein
MQKECVHENGLFRGLLAERVDIVFDADLGFRGK